MLQGHKLTMPGGKQHSGCQVFGSHWRWRRRTRCKHPCSQKSASHPRACQANHTARQCDQGHHMLDPRCCRDTWLHLALAAIKKKKSNHQFSSNFKFKVPFISSNSNYLRQSWQTKSVVIIQTIEGSIHAIVDIVHQGPVTEPFVFICHESINYPCHYWETFQMMGLLWEYSIYLKLWYKKEGKKTLPSEPESSSMMTFLAMILTTSV